MLPTTICAGMTLPLLTKRLMGETVEGAIGAVYAVNTIRVGCRRRRCHACLVTAFGGGHGACRRRWIGFGFGTFVAFLAGASSADCLYHCRIFNGGAVFGEVDPRIAASGIFRQGQARINDREIIIFHRDGKTATISVVDGGNFRSIKTNGKTDAGIIKGDIADSAYTGDEVTMLLSGLLPLLINRTLNWPLTLVRFGHDIQGFTFVASVATLRYD